MRQSMDHEPRIAPELYRRVLGTYPTGVCVVTATTADGRSLGLTVGTFTSVSLDPPLVGFLPSAASRRWQVMRDCTSFCINILAHDQEWICRAFATSDSGEPDGIPWVSDAAGPPRIDGAVAWIEADMDRVEHFGDHYFVTGHVRSMQETGDSSPLLFLRGGYGRMAHGALVTGDGRLATALRVVDALRHHMDELAARFGGRCIATTVDGQELVVMASAGGEQRGLYNHIGARSRLVAPVGALFAAYESLGHRRAWLRTAGAGAQDWDKRLTVVADRGYSVILDHPNQRSFEDSLGAQVLRLNAAWDEEAEEVLASLPVDPLDFSWSADAGDVRAIEVPIFDDQQMVSVTLMMFLPRDARIVTGFLEQCLSALLEVAMTITLETDGALPTRWPGHLGLPIAPREKS